MCLRRVYIDVQVVNKNEKKRKEKKRKEKKRKEKKRKEKKKIKNKKRTFIVQSLALPACLLLCR